MLKGTFTHLLIPFVLCTIPVILFAQINTPYSYVNPFIGSSSSHVITQWGSEGGVYPGAVAPSGFVQLSPETRVSGARGYNYADSSIYFFSCLHHLSGFPGGSSGRLFIMPIAPRQKFQLYKYHRPYTHQKEKSEPGYYRVLFTDNNTLAEATASERAGIFRITFPAHITPSIFIGDAGVITAPSSRVLHATNFNTVINCSEAYTSKTDMADGCILTFPAATTAPAVIEIRLSASPVGFESAQKNIDVDMGTKNFDAVREHTSKKWEEQLSVISIDDNNTENKTIFYTALYHSLLVPWIISDADGKYRGSDGLIHTTAGKNEYGAFSPWDTFHSLHPLLCLLYPEKQNDIILSMLNVYLQSGYLPTESMTGNHAIPIIADTYLKGITGFDSSLAYAAMKKSIVNGPFLQTDMQVYQQQGYIPFTHPESVTRTTEYAYDDWALSQFAKQAMHAADMQNESLQRAYNYRHLFNARELFLLPRSDNEFITEPGNTGYKEGDKWSYSYFAPHNGKNLVNLMGGNDLFTSRLDEALHTGKIIFDNETIFHIPYLFNIAGHPSKTQEWVRKIMHTGFSATPGGLPGNDDLGAVSSWYVFSAMGIFPLCPGRPLYAIGSPLFRSLTMHLANGKNFIIKAGLSTRRNIYVSALSVNKKKHDQLWIPHASIEQGGEMDVTMSAKPVDAWSNDTSDLVFSETRHAPKFTITACAVSKSKIEPDEKLVVYFSVKNEGSAGTKQIKLFVNGKEYDHTNCLVAAATTITDSIICRLYPVGKIQIGIDTLKSMLVEIVAANKPGAGGLRITGLTAKPIIPANERQNFSFTAQNISGYPHRFNIPVRLNHVLIGTHTVMLQPGEKKIISQKIPIHKAGINTLDINSLITRFKMFEKPAEATMLDLSFTNITGDSLVPDRSGFGNNGKITRTVNNNINMQHEKLLLGKDCFVEVPGSASLDSMGETITMMLWVYPEDGNDGLTDIFTKGDNHVLQVMGNKQLSFFAGGWGRGDCTVELPSNWLHHWHHIAGVCDGKYLHLYIDGNLKGSTKLDRKMNLSVAAKWCIGRNEEFPNQRIFNGYADKVKVFALPLTRPEIRATMNRQSPLSDVTENRFTPPLLVFLPTTDSNRINFISVNIYK